MPATKAKSRKKGKVAAKKKPAQPQFAAPVTLLAAAATGAVLGLSAPGINFWYVAWFGLVPFLLLTVSSNGLKQAFIRGLVFGTAYNLVYLNWYLHLHPLDWMGFAWWESMLMSAAAWLIVSLHQGLIIACIGAAVRALPLTGGFFPRTVEEKWSLPALLVVPLLWVLMENKIGNAHDLLGVPWAMLEYSQYRQLAVLQISSWIGGIGIGALIVAVNTALASTVATLSGRLGFKSLAAQTSTSAITHLLTICCCVLGVVAFGYSRLATGKSGPMETLSVLQGNINIEMQKNSAQRATLDDLSRRYETLAAKAPPGFCVWTESALPTYLKEEKSTLTQVENDSVGGNHDMVVGSIDKGSDGLPYNSAFGITHSGMLLPNVYHKRYLVPFGEYMPSFCKYLPEAIQKLTNTPAGSGFAAGKFPIVLNFGAHRVAPLICFETISPELVTTSVRNGGTLLVNLSDLAWFHDSIVGDQMIAFSVMRAVETGRDFVFAANTGPSAIIDSSGRITARSSSGKTAVLTGRVMFHKDETPFTQWFN